MPIKPVDIRRSDAKPLAKGGRVGNGLNKRSAESETAPADEDQHGHPDCEGGGRAH